MTCAEFHELVAAHALGALDAAEAARMEAHLAETAQHEGCAEALRRAVETAALLGAALPAPPPPAALWDRIANEIGIDRPAASPSREEGRRATPPPARRPAWREAAAWGLAAAAALLAFVTHVDRRKTAEELAASRRELARVDDVDRQKQACLNELASAQVALRQKAAAIQLIDASGTRLVQLAAQGDVPYRASAIVNAMVPNAMVISSALEPRPDKDYQLWLIRGDRKISAGVLPAAGAATTIATVPRELLAEGAPDAFAVTVEPKGGVDQPTGPIVLVGALPRT